MQLPAALREAIEDRLASADTKRLQTAAAALSDSYRQARAEKPAMAGESERLAYLAVRMPATYAVVTEALRQASTQLRGAEVVSLLDLGAGPGTAAWAATGLFPGLRRLLLVERDTALIELGGRLASASPTLVRAEWLQADLSTAAGWERFPGQKVPREGSGSPADAETAAPELFDLVIASYSLGELPAGQQNRFLRQAWSRTRRLLVIVEAGSTAGFTCLLRARQELIGQGAHLLAPCPHAGPCPLAPESQTESSGRQSPGRAERSRSADWCHFAARVERTSVHRRLKGAELGYEDEKFFYLAVTPGDGQPAESRIIRRPDLHSGFVELRLCTANGLGKQTVGRSDRQRYRAARGSSWGDPWGPNT